MRVHLVLLGVLPPLALATSGAIGSPAFAQAPQDSPAPPGAATGPGVGGTAVIRPPAGIDPGINKLPPAAARQDGRMPVIPPPGSAGDPAVVAK